MNGLAVDFKTGSVQTVWDEIKSAGKVLAVALKLKLKAALSMSILTGVVLVRTAGKREHIMKSIAIALASLLLTSVLVGQISPQAPPRSLSEIMDGFQSAQWDERANALDALMKIPGVLQKPEVRSALVALQNKENGYLRIPDPNTPGGVPAAQTYSESYGDPYLTDLMALLKIIAERYNEPGAVAALAAGGYNPDSDFAGWLADQRESVPVLLRLAQVDPPFACEDDVYVLARILARDRRVGQPSVRSFKLMDEQTQKRTLALIRSAVAHPEACSRWGSLDAIAMVGDENDLSSLRKLKESDPHSVAHTKEVIQKFSDRLKSEQSIIK